MVDHDGAMGLGCRMISKITANALVHGALLSFLVFSGAACSKTISPEKEKEKSLAWNEKTTIAAYNHAGFCDARWDKPARACLEEFSRSLAGETNSYEPFLDIISTNASAAVDAGCQDPLVRYLYIRYSMSQTNSRVAFTEAFWKTAVDMNASSYPPIRKFYACARALQQLYDTYGTNSASHVESSELVQMTTENLDKTLAEKSTPAEDAYQVSHLALYLMSGDSGNEDSARQIVERQFERNWPDSYQWWYMKGSRYINLAWEARGSSYANQVTPEGWTGFSNNLSLAQDALERAWKINPKDPEIAVQMMSVILGQGGGRDRMELWFNRAMNLDTNDYEACSRKLYYLEPKWYGSDEDQLAFGRECVQSKKWGGRVPLTLIDAHLYIDGRLQRADQTNYWKRPDVWADIQAAYDRFFELNPDATGYYHNYAWYAYHAEQWDKLNELIPKLGPVNYDFFGGREEYDKMVQLAKQHGSSNPP